MDDAMRSAIAAVALLAAGAGGTASAQQLGPAGVGFTGFGAPRFQAGPPGPLRIQVNMQVQMPAERDATIEAQKTTVETAHAALYDLAMRECATITKAFEGDCRITGLNVGSQNFGPNPAATYTLSATIEVTPSQPAPPPPPR